MMTQWILLSGPAVLRNYFSQKSPTALGKTNQRLKREAGGAYAFHVAGSLWLVDF